MTTWLVTFVRRVNLATIAVVDAEDEHDAVLQARSMLTLVELLEVRDTIVNRSPRNLPELTTFDHRASLKKERPPASPAPAARLWKT